MDIGLFALRAVVGLLFIAHGTQKLFGWFGGYGLEGTGGWMSSLGFRHGRTAALGAGLAEALGGTMLFLGLFTWLGAAMIIGVMINAIVTVHMSKGMWNTAGGSEFPLTLVAVSLALAFCGPGRFSVDAALGMSDPSVLSGSLALSLGVIASAVVLSTRSVAPASNEAPVTVEEETRRRAA